MPSCLQFPYPGHSRMFAVESSKGPSCLWRSEGTARRIPNLGEELLSFPSSQPSGTICADLILTQGDFAETNHLQVTLVVL